jgi:CBS domain-containing protein
MEFPELLRKNHVKMMIQKDLNVLKEDASLEQVIDSLNTNNVSYCVIVEKENNNLLGLITEADIFQLAGKNFSKDIKAKDLAKMYPDEAFYEDTIASVVKKMYKNQFRQIPILDPEDKTKTLGVVSVRDFVSHLIEYFPETVYNVIPGQKLSTENREGA